MFRLSPFFFLFCLLHVAGFPAAAAAQSTITGCKADLIESLTNEQLGPNHVRLVGSSGRAVRVDCDNMQFFAGQIDVFDQERLVAVGDIVFVSGKDRISADRLEFNTKTKTGTFFKASGTTVIRDKADPGLEGSQEPNAFFWGEEIRKEGPKTYRIIKGGFTSCVQPTARWEVASGNMTIKVDDYALLRNSVFRVKGVPILYLPIFYYPMEEDDRSTGFTMPIYGNSTLGGQTISNQFFWAIGRSHDASFVHDWLSKAGQGYGAEYRYALSGGAGDARFHALHEQAVSADEATPTLPQRAAAKSYRIDGRLSQQLPLGLRAQASANYFTSLSTQQRYQQDPFYATDRRRSFGANMSGAWAGYTLSARVDQNDYFDSQNTLTRTGSRPRITVSRGERMLGNLPIYVGATGEYVTLIRSTVRQDIESVDQGLTRLDILPTVRVPFTRWPFLSITSSVSWRGTYWSESLNLAGARLAEGIGRSFFDFKADLRGPIFNRIFDTPDNGFATRWKHVIEPTLSVQRTTAVDNFNQIVQLESGTDYIVGGVTRYVYGLSNRLYAKKENSREIASLTINQSYYTQAIAAQCDPNYVSSCGTSAPDPSADVTNFSPVSVLARLSPADHFQGQFRTEWNPTAKTLTTLSAGGSFAFSEQLLTSANWSRRRYIPGLTGFDNEASASHGLDAQTTLRFAQNRFGGTYFFMYDFRRDLFIQQRIQTYYNAQCCGFAVEFQTFDMQNVPGVAVQKDRRFNISFSLAGIGTFSNFLGALAGQQPRR
jgi:LPS-assembly protein